MHEAQTRNLEIPGSMLPHRPGMTLKNWLFENRI
jgi:hypothetical protein